MCQDMLTNPLPQNVSSAPLPCSLKVMNGVTNLANPHLAYATLDLGISQVSSSFQSINFTKESTDFQIVTTVQNGTTYVVFFYPDAAQEFDRTYDGFGPDYGIDFAANTTSMVTQCKFATRDCNITTANNTDTLTLDQNNISIPFHCYDDFSGDLGKTPSTGHERAQSWNTSFYELIDGSPQNVPVQSQSNPFTFYVAAAVNSIDPHDIDHGDGTLVNVGGGFTAFALSCSASIYDIRFSIINGSFYGFEPTLSSPQKASIIKAPLQVGFGQYSLYESAFPAVLSNHTSVPDYISQAFSQTGMALASGAFDFSADGMEYQPRWTKTVTEVQKAPFWFLVIVCLVYSLFGIVMTVMAFLLRRSLSVREQQARLMVG